MGIFGATFLLRLFQVILAIIVVGFFLILLTTVVTWMIIIAGNMIGFNTNSLKNWITRVFRVQPEE